MGITIIVTYNVESTPCRVGIVSPGYIFILIVRGEDASSASLLFAVANFLAVIANAAVAVIAALVMKYNIFTLNAAAMSFGRGFGLIIRL